MTTTRRRAVRGTAAALAGTLLASTLAVAATTTATVPFAAPAAAEPGDVLLTESFDGDTLPEGWTPVLGDWQVRDGRLVGDAPDGSSPARIVFGRSAENYRLEATLRFESVDNASRWAGAILDVAPDGAVPWWQAVLRSTTTAHNGVEIAQRTPANAWNVPYTASAPADAATGRDVRLSVEVQGAAVTYALDGRTLLEGRIDRSRDGALGFVTAGATVSVDDVTVTEIEPASYVGDDGELPVTVAHRGYSSVAPENTLAAVAAGMRTGAEYVEIDVHTTADGLPVVLHDQTVDRTTEGSGDVAVLPGAQVAALDAGSWFSPAFAGQHLPTFAQVLDLLETGSSTLLLEIKGPETSTEVERVVDMVVEAGLEDRVVLQSFDVAALRYAREHAPQIPRGLLRGSLDADPVAVAQELGAVMYNPSATALLARPGVVADLNEAGIAVMPYTVNSAADWARLTEIGVDGVITDRAGAFIGWKQAREQEAPAPAAPTIEVVSPAEGAEVERGGTLVVAASATDADEVVVSLDGEPVENGAAIVAADLALGEHTVSATARGAGGEATAERTVVVTVTPEGLRARVAVLDLPPGQLVGALTAIEAGRWESVRRTLEKFVDDAATRERLLEELDHLAGR
ncbi:glycerophosphodiester phosphodiesterase family protein [Cellulosimicrobium cellulans]|uniref:glycerophosphodiester phosphodiesterase family protein n=1 Tax=Cellulosimicrobium cellulans TaxID=1710 RepID=UPI002404B762|nr:glycerophosphodiester phosphodiesterase family protein [Cellulosimicrobium cellulans]MDF9876666.1 glycerophosphoryl diester phosphodiesterase [Cellulosimicrobium cellulans]